ncbi:hypothetical protein D0863_00150 [Hortaea werneckii]|uniref:SAC3/GANP/THP3 conserved domain-containing protein n=1 Tax=Hortaea werneckii TaxID=91943 RepID=A0A3M7ERT7_HORWE|nr:hypothetical protein D0863_00150 [Hortaea werneckii]
MQSTAGGRGGGPRGRGRGNGAARGRGASSFRGGAGARGNAGGRRGFGQSSRGDGAGKAARGGPAAGFKANTFKPAPQQQSKSNPFANNTPATSIPSSAAASDGNAPTLSQRQAQLEKARDRERKDAIAKGFIADPNKARTLAEAITPVGTCRDMCAEFERVERTIQCDVKPEERGPDGSPDESRMVKKFRRAAAGLEEQLPSDLRPPPVLKQTCDYLFNTLIAEAPSLGSVEHFVWDRTRAVRNDFSIQQLSKAEDLSLAIDCLERIVRFHILTLHLCSVEPKPTELYDAQQEREQLDRTLLSLMQYYDDSRGRVDMPNEAEFRAYCIIFQIQDPIPDMEDRVQSWPRHIALDHRVRVALELYAAACNTMDSQGPLKPRASHLVAQQDWAKFWELVASKRVSYLMACTAEIYFNLIRRTALQGIWRSYRMKPSKALSDACTIDFLEEVLALDNEEQVVRFCEAYGFVFEEREDGERYLDLLSVKTDTNVLGEPNATLPKQMKSRLVELKRFDRTCPSIISGYSVQKAEENGMRTHEDEEADEGMEEDLEQSQEQGQPMADYNTDDGESLFIPEEPQQPEKAAKPATNGFSGFGAPSNSSLGGFGQPSTASNGFGQPSGAFSGFGKPSTVTQEPPKSGFSFLSSPAQPATTNATEKPATTTPFTPGTFSWKPSESKEKENSTPAKDTASIFSQPRKNETEGANPFSGLFGQQDTGKPIGQDQELSKPRNPFAETAPNSPNEQTSFGLPQSAPSIFGSEAGSTSSQPPSAFQQPEAKPHPPPSPPKQHTQPHSQSAAPQSPTQSHAQLPPQPPSPSSGIYGRKSSNSYQPKKPSPLVQSESVEEATGPHSDPLHVQSVQDKGRPQAGELFPPLPNFDAVGSSRRETAAKDPSPRPAALPSQSPQPAQPDLASIVSRLAREITVEDPKGFLHQYAEFAAQQIVVEVQAQVALERETTILKRLKSSYLCRKFGARWKEIFWGRKFAKRGTKRRERARRGLEESKRQSTEGSTTGSIFDMGSTQSHVSEPHRLPRASGRLARPNEGTIEQSQARAGSKRPSSPLSTDFETEAQGHKRMKSASHVDDRGRVTKPTPPSSDPNADILKRASFLGFSMPITSGKDEAVPPVRRSNYFRLRAAGVPTEWDDNLRGTKRKLSDSGPRSTLSPSLRTSPQPKLARSGDDQTLKMSALTKTTTAPPSFSSANGVSQQASAAGPAVNAAAGTSDHRDEDIIARVRRAREALARGADDFKKDMETEMKVRESLRSSTSSNDSPSLVRARAEARLAASHGNSTSYSAASNVPAYRLRESRFVPREQYGKAIERSKEMRASRSKEISRPTSRMEDSKQTFDFDSPSKKQESQFSTFDFANPSQKQSREPAFRTQPEPQQTFFSHSQEIPESQSESVGFGTHSQLAPNSKTQLEGKPNGFSASDFTGWQPPSTIETPSQFNFQPMAEQRPSEIQDSQPNHFQASTGTTKAQNPFSGFSAGSGFVSQSNFGGLANGTKSAFGAQSGTGTSTFGFGSLPKSPSPAPAVHVSQSEQAQDNFFRTEEQPDHKTEIQHDYTIQPNHIDDSLSTSFAGQKSQPHGFTEATDMFGRPRSQAHGLGQSTFSSFGQQSSPARAQEGFPVPTPEEVNLVSDGEEEDSQPPYASQFAQNLASAANGLYEQQDTFEESEEDEEEVQDSYQYSSNPYAALARDAGGDTEEDYDESEDGQGYDTETQEPNGYGQTGVYKEEQGGYEGEEEDLEDFDEEDEEEPFDDEETIGGPSSFGRQQGGYDSESAGCEESDMDEDEDEEDEEIDPSTPIWNRAPSANPDLQGVGGTAEEAIELSD